MKNRRKFLLNGSMAAVALLTAEPFTTFASSINLATGFPTNNNSLVLAHTGNTTGSVANDALQRIIKLKKRHANLIMLHVGDTEPGLQAVYDASLQSSENYLISSDDYRIVYKGNIKTGIITANSKSASINKINEIAGYLKKEKNCQLVVCLSQLGYESSGNLDDRSLAASSTHLDAIIGGHPDNFCKHPFIAMNRNSQEVIINHAATEGLALHKIEIGFDNSGKKAYVSFTKTC